MIKNFEEYKTYRSRYLTEGIPAEESAEIEKEMDDFRKNNPEIFRKMSEAKWVGSLTDPQ
ncbi:hypothetical protein [Methanobrevibacter arboriphilus]|uniref:Uncharacterized protein n=1 Tax=Methanobrevibacter arboriphilus TaxID=39441 RepID=A0ACA8R1U5_METAZ|nr:hypothetical protein [Methanobrevibacter arboriphilus]BBL61513.1 hypothetical protein MarbSA_05530 [Methanobrevibacter arboriphilus]